MTTSSASGGAVTVPIDALPARRPGTHRPAAPRPAQRFGYDLDRTWDLLAETRELPATERGLLKVLVEYRKALYALATQLEAIYCGQQPSEPGAPPRAAAPPARAREPTSAPPPSDEHAIHQRTDHPPSRLP